MRAVYATGTSRSPSQDVAESGNGRDPQLGTSTPPPHIGHPTLLHRTNVDLTMFVASVKVELDEKLSAELFRSTKKLPPSRLTYGLLYVSTFSCFPF